MPDVEHQHVADLVRLRERPPYVLERSPISTGRRPKPRYQVIGHVGCFSLEKTMQSAFADDVHQVDVSISRTHNASIVLTTRNLRARTDWQSPAGICREAALLPDIVVDPGGRRHIAELQAASAVAQLLGVPATETVDCTESV